MPSSTLTSHDISILSKIKDPEASASSPLLIDDSLPKDPHITSSTLYISITQLERSIITSIQAIELQIAGLRPSPSPTSEPPLTRYLAGITSLTSLITQHPNYASARNNRAQALRRVYGDGILLASSQVSTSIKKNEAPLCTTPSEDERKQASTTMLTDLSTAITLLTPTTPYSPISPTAARTLSQAFTQRGAIYLFTSKSLPSTSTATDEVKSRLLVGEERREAKWSKEDFEENASRDFMMGGRYGNEVAKALAVASNPTAKLCGAIVQEAMRKEFQLGGSGGKEA